MTTHLPKVKRIAHIALFVSDPEASAKWYTDVLGMMVSARAGDGPYAGGIFMSFGVSDHDIGLFPRTPQTSHGVEFEHIGLELDCNTNLDSLKKFYAHLLEHNVKVHEILDHGVSKGIYFYDPDGHMLEVFCQQITGEAAIDELSGNQGMAAPYSLQPIT